MKKIYIGLADIAPLNPGSIEGWPSDASGGYTLMACHASGPDEFMATCMDFLAIQGYTLKEFQDIKPLDDWLRTDGLSEEVLESLREDIGFDGEQGPYDVWWPPELNTYPDE